MSWLRQRLSWLIFLVHVLNSSSVFLDYTLKQKRLLPSTRFLTNHSILINFFYDAIIELLVASLVYIKGRQCQWPCGTASLTCKNISQSINMLDFRELWPHETDSFSHSKLAVTPETKICCGFYDLNTQHIFLLHELLLCIPVICGMYEGA